MAFVAPLLLVGLAAAAIPVLLHLIQREKKTVVEFPSLMFLRRIPYQSVRRRRIRHWLLLLVRVTALALLVLAFARPFFRRAPAAAAAQAGAREVVFALDASYSMGYGTRWERARAEAQKAVDGLSGGDRGSLVVFGTTADATVRSTTDRSKLAAAIRAAVPGPGATRFAPALKLAGSILAESALPRREIVFVSDFQRRGWQDAAGRDDVRLPARTTVTPVQIADPETANLSVTPVTLQRSRFENHDRVAVTAGIVNRGAKPASVPLTLHVNGQVVQTASLEIAANGTATTTFAPFTVASRNMRCDVTIPDDALPRDNVFDFVVSSSDPIRVVIVDRPGAESEGFYAARALGIGETPRVDVVTRTSVGDEDLRGAAILLLNDVQVDDGAAARIARFVNAGGGLFIAAGPHAAWPAAQAPLVPGTLGGAVDRTTGTPARLGTLEYSHPVFDLFRAPRTGDFSAARFYGYRAVSGAPAPLARFDDGGAALVEKRVGAGRVLLWTSTLDLGWNDFALKPVYLPFLHTVMTYLADYTERPPALTIGQVVPVRRRPDRAAADAPAVVVTPSGKRTGVDAEDGAIELTEQGFYDVRARGASADSATVIASNVDLTESDLAAMPPAEFVASLSGGGAAAASFADVRPTDDAQAQAQRIWWYLLAAAALLLAAETFLSNRVSTARSS